MRGYANACSCEEHQKTTTTTATTTKKDEKELKKEAIITQDASEQLQATRNFGLSTLSFSLSPTGSPSKRPCYFASERLYQKKSFGLLQYSIPILLLNLLLLVPNFLPCAEHVY